MLNIAGIGQVVICKSEQCVSKYKGDWVRCNAAAKRRARGLHEPRRNALFMKLHNLISPKPIQPQTGAGESMAQNSLLHLQLDEVADRSRHSKKCSAAISLQALCQYYICLLLPLSLLLRVQCSSATTDVWARALNHPRTRNVSSCDSRNCLRAHLTLPHSIDHVSCIHFAFVVVVPFLFFEFTRAGFWLQLRQIQEALMWNSC